MKQPLKNYLYCFGAGIVTAGVFGAITRPSDRIYKQEGRVMARIDGKSYPIINDQMGDIKHRLTGLLNESPEELYRTIDELVKE